MGNCSRRDSGKQSLSMGAVELTRNMAFPPSDSSAPRTLLCCRTMRPVLEMTHTLPSIVPSVS